MKKRTYVTGKELTDKQWAKFELLIPEPLQSRKGGQHRAPNHSCLEGIIWILRTGARWCDLPEYFPSGSACWRRMAEWQAKGIWIKKWKTFLGLLDKKSRLKWENVYADGMFVPAKKGGSRQNKAWKGVQK